jgi:hypothetical protein
MDRLTEIKRLYYQTRAATIQQDLRRAVELAKGMTEPERERAAVFLDGLSQMRSEWGATPRRRGPAGKRR